jgi:predicted amidohydrolase YtcJ
METLIITGIPIHRMSSSQVHEAVAMKNGKIVSVGSLETVKKAADKDAKIIPPK